MGLKIVYKYIQEEKMRAAYPVLIKESKGTYLVYVPDMDIHTEGKDLEDAIRMARDAIGLTGIALEDESEAIPKASSYDDAISKAKKGADDIFDYSDGIITLVDVDFIEARREVESIMVKKNTTIPSWMALQAEKLKINVSQVLQEALAEKIKNIRGQ